VRFLVHRPIAVMTLFLALLVLGLVSYRLLPVTLMPDVDIPVITVQVSDPKSTARELEGAVVSRMRSDLMQVSHLRDILTETTDGAATLRLLFEYGTSIDYAFIEVNEKIDLGMASYPQGLSRPRVIKASAQDLPVFYLNVTLRDDSVPSNADGPGRDDTRFVQLSNFCDQVLRRRLEQLPEVAMVDMSGLASPEILIRPKKDKMESLGLRDDIFSSALTSRGAGVGSMSVRDGYFQYSVRFATSIISQEDIADIHLQYNGKMYQLQDLAEVVLRPAEPRGMFLDGPSRGVTMAVIQQSEAKMADLKEALNNQIQRFEKDYPQMQFSVSQDQSILLDYTIGNLIQNLVTGCILAFLVLLFFLNDFRAPLLIGITVPIAMVLSFIFFHLMHLSINIISLSGLALGIGMIVDCSIIVLDNIIRYKGMGHTLREACVRGTNEVMVPMLSSTFTTSSVFLPLIFMSGMAGALFFDEAVSVSLGNFASFIVAVTLLPVMVAILYSIRNKKASSTEPARDSLMQRLGQKLCISERFEQGYEHGLEWVFRHKTVTTLIVALLLVSVVFLFRVIEVRSLPEMDQTEMRVQISWNQNIHVEENRRRTIEMLSMLDSFLLSSNSYIGEQTFVLNQQKNLDYYQTELYLKVQRSGQLPLVEEQLRALFDRQYPLATLTILPPVNLFEQIFETRKAPLEAQVGVPTNPRMPVDSIVAFVAEADRRMGAYAPNVLPFKEYLSIGLIQERLLLYGVSQNAVMSALRSAFGEEQVMVLRSSQRDLPIVLGTEPMRVQETLSTLKVANAQGDQIPVSFFISVFRDRDLKFITGGEQGEYLPLSYHIRPRDMDSAKSVLRTLVREWDMPQVQFGGSIVENRSMIGELSLILMVSVLLLYCILAAQFESLLQPLIVLLELPVDIAGALFLLWVCGDSLNLMSGIGLVVMCGVIINDSILKVDTINRFRKDGMPLMEAIQTGGRVRLRSIVMTSLTTICGILPFLWSQDMGSELQRPLSLALIGGMTLGTLVSLYFIPLAYWFVYRRSENVRGA